MESDATFRDKITQQLQSNRPNLSTSSLKTYSSILHNLYDALSQQKETQKNNDIIWFDENTDKILHHIKNKNQATKKSTLSALYVLTNVPLYQKEMMKISQSMSEQAKEQKKTRKQEENWISIEEIKDKYEDLHDKVTKIFKKKAIADIGIIMDYLLVAFLSGHKLPPRRSMDYSLLKWKNYDKTRDNYYSRGKLYFNKYKTSDTYGLAIIDVPKEIDGILKKWLKINPSEMVLISSNNKPLSSSQIARMLNKIFDKKVSVNMLRHIYLTNYYKNIPKLTNMEELANSMGHNIQTALEHYVKKD